MIPTLTPKKENWISVIVLVGVEPVGVTDAIFPVDPSPNEMLPSGPGVMKAGLLKVGVRKYVNLPSGVMRATSLLLERVNQKLPSGPIVIAKGWLPPRMGKLLELGGMSLDGNAWEVGKPTQSASTASPRVNLSPNVWRKSANIARADAVQ